MLDHIYNDQLVEEVKKLAENLNRSPYPYEYERSALAIKRFESWGQFLDYAGLEWIKENLTNDELIEEVKNISTELGGIPKTSEFPHLELVINRFGNWSNFLIASGLKKNKKRISDEELIGELQQLAKDLGRTPKSNEYNRTPLAYRRFGPWRNFLELAGLETFSSYITNEELIANVKELAKELERTPKAREFEHFNTVLQRYKNWNTFLKDAGLETTIEIIPDEQLIKEIQEIAKEIHTTPMPEDYPRSELVDTRFSSWNIFLTISGINKINKTLSANELIAEARKLAEKLKRPPRINEFIYYSLVEEKFVSWNAFLKKAGLEVSRKAIPKEVLLEEIKNLSEDLGRAPKSSEYKHSTAMYKHFDSWIEFLLEAGITPSKKQLIKDIRKNAKKLDRLPAEHEYKYSAVAINIFTSWDNFLIDAKLKYPECSCVICGKHVKRKDSKYCSRKCYSKDRQSIKTCVVCGKEFPDPPSSPKVCCSPECSKQHRQQLQSKGNYDSTNQKWLTGKKEYYDNHKGELHPNAKYWKIQSPTSKVYEMTNLKEFIRDNIDLFDGSTVKQAFDGIVKIKASQQGKRKNPSYSYKGWKLLSWHD